MFWLFRRFCTVLGFLVCVLGALYVARNLAVKYTLCWVIPHTTTFGCSIDRVEVESRWPLRIHLRDVRIENPPNFSDSLAMEIPNALLELPSHCWQNDTLLFSLIDLQVARLNLVNSELGDSNLAHFSDVAERNSEPPSGFEFEVLQLRITDPHHEGTFRFTKVDSQKKLVDIFHTLTTAR